MLIAAPVSAKAEAPVILVFGDSISAGYGLARVEQGWVALLQTRLKEQEYGYQVIKASVSGETTAGGLARLPRALMLHQPRIVVLELGGNDGLRALPIAQMRANLVRMIALSPAAGAKVLLLGMRMPPNYGPDFTEQFRSCYSDVARDKKLPLVPFLLNDIALSPNLMQADGIHPNELGQPQLLANVWPSLQPLLRRYRRDTHPLGVPLDAEVRRQPPSALPDPRVTTERSATRRRRRGSNTSRSGAATWNKYHPCTSRSLPSDRCCSRPPWAPISRPTTWRRP